MTRPATPSAPAGSPSPLSLSSLAKIEWEDKDVEASFWEAVHGGGRRCWNASKLDYEKPLRLIIVSVITCCEVLERQGSCLSDDRAVVLFDSEHQLKELTAFPGFTTFTRVRAESVSRAAKARNIRHPEECWKHQFLFPLIFWTGADPKKCRSVNGDDTDIFCTSNDFFSGNDRFSGF